MLLLTACQGGSKLPAFAAGDGGLKVQLPDVCEGFLLPVPQPKVTRSTDARLAYIRAADALDEANVRISDGAECERDQRQAYVGKAYGGKDKPK